MFDQYDYQQYGTTTAAPKYTKQNKKPMPSREELLARNSFGSPDDNPYITTAAQRKLRAAERELEIQRQKVLMAKWGVK